MVKSLRFANGQSAAKEVNIIMNRKIEFQNKLKKRFPKSNLEVIEYSDCKSATKIKCLSCNKVYNFKVAENAYRKDKIYFCRHCEKEVSRNPKVQELMNNFSEVKNKYEIINFRPQNIKNTIRVKCKKCGYVRETSLENFVNGIDCPKCETRNVLLTKEEVQEYFDKNNIPVIILGDYVNNVTPTLFKCKDCGFIWKTRPGNIKTGNRCPKCAKKESQGERKIKEWLNNHNILFQREVAIKGEETNNNFLRFDFFCKDYNLAIEYNGIQHYKPVVFFGGEEELLKTKERDERKRKYCENHNIKLITIAYSDFDKIDKILSSTFND